MIYASIVVYREDNEIEIMLSGQYEFEVSPNPRETGYHISDWSIDSPRFFELTKAEAQQAERALEASI